MITQDNTHVIIQITHDDNTDNIVNNVWYITVLLITRVTLITH